MIYQGNKRDLLKYILPIIQNCIFDNNIKYYYEPFVGGANVIDSIKCEHKYGSDINDELISLLIYMRDNPTIPIASKDCSFEHYADVREDRKNKTGKYSKEYIAMIGFFASFGGRYFDGGYGRDKKGGRCIYAERLKYARNQAPNLKGIEFKACSFEDYNPNDYNDCIFYLDPPYRDTKGYDVKEKFPYEKFYSWCKELGKNNYVFISEYNMPDDFDCVWSMDRKVLQKSDRTHGDVATEKLFYLGKKELKENNIFDL